VASRPRMVAGQPAYVAIVPLLCHKGMVVEITREIVEGKRGKEGEGGRSAMILWPTGHAWPPLNSYFHSPLHLAHIMLTPLTKSIKSKQIPFILFQSSFYLFFEIFRFYIK
jgi:hypothetical protein